VTGYQKLSRRMKQGISWVEEEARERRRRLRRLTLEAVAPSFRTWASRLAAR
jgi:hypothetical protein